MTAKVFIDGEVGTTGLQIRARLENRPDISLISLPEENRKSRLSRIGAFGEADIAILCLPDDAVHEIAPDLREHARAGHRRLHGAPDRSRLGLRLRRAGAGPAGRDRGGEDRLQPGMLFDRGHRADPAAPGCRDHRARQPDHDQRAVGLYRRRQIHDRRVRERRVTGGFVYKTDQTHKHLPEIVARTGLTRKPIFVPQVGQYAQGMIVQVPLHLAPGGVEAAMQALTAHYGTAASSRWWSATRLGPASIRRCLNGTNRMQLTVDGDRETGATVLIAVLDNLGKGASGAAVQNLNIMLGLDEATGL
jgi:N-acetyl-gamma-glutamyl-phosphate reductase